MKKNSFYIVSLIIFALFCTATSFNSYATFDTLSEQKNITLDSGKWDYGMSAKTYYTGFEDAVKTAYAAGNITTSGMLWHFNDALIGTLSTDQKYENRSARLRDGHITTLFSIENLRILNFYAGRFGSDTGGEMGIYLSDNQSNWYLYQNVTITTEFKYYHIYFEETILNSMSLSRADKLYLRFEYNGSNRVNIDEVNITYVVDPNMELNLFENFETGVKGNTNYGIVNLNGLNWIFDGALIGAHQNDKKYNSKAARISNGYISTEFKIAKIYELSFYLASYGNDQSSTVYVEVSKNKTNWSKISPDYSSTSALTLRTIVFNNALLAPHGLSTTDALYIRIRSVGNRRVNVDNLDIKYVGIDSLITE
ncbi:MAG: hypothetical protein EOM87_06995 [Clostridia bacterium]|nr:hypothetical protein [Clostridia bacterium]